MLIFFKIAHLSKIKLMENEIKITLDNNEKAMELYVELITELQKSIKNGNSLGSTAYVNKVYIIHLLRHPTEPAIKITQQPYEKPVLNEEFYEDYKKSLDCIKKWSNSNNLDCDLTPLIKP